LLQKNRDIDFINKKEKASLLPPEKIKELRSRRWVDTQASSMVNLDQNSKGKFGEFQGVRKVPNKEKIIPTS